MRRPRQVAAPAAAGIAVVLSTVVGPPALAGQGGAASLDAVDSLVALGRADEARQTLSTWLATRQSAASRADLQRSLWLRGILTVDPAQAAVDFQRLVVEFPGGAWTDDALLRLAGWAEARGELAEAAGRYRAILRDHPGGPASGVARRWLERRADVLEGVREEGPARMEEDASRPEPAGGPPPEEPPPAGEWTVQLGAFSTRERARDLMDRARGEGFEPRLVRVPGSGLMRVRIGRFYDAGGARGLAERASARGFDVILASDADEEVAAGG